MKCNEARRMVVPYVKKELSEHDMEQFLNHVESCEDCMDELDMYYTVYHALHAMDSGARHEYDFQKLLAEDIRSAKRTIFLKKLFTAFRTVLLACAEVLLVFCLITGVQMKQGNTEDAIFDRAILRLYIEERNSAADRLQTETDAEETAETDAQTGYKDVESDASAEETDNKTEVLTETE